MTRTPFDQFCKRLLEEFLSPLGDVQLNLEVPGESRFVDVWFMPNAQRGCDADSLGLLGRLVATPCLIEPFRNPPSPAQVRNCLLKLLLVEADVGRRARRVEEQLSEAELPKLWILTPTASKFGLDGFGANPDGDWLFPSIYFMPPQFRTAIVVLNQLPSTPETLWLRLLGKGTTQRQAVEEVLALPKDDPQRAIALRLLVGWKITIEASGEVDAEDREVVMTLAKVYQELVEREREAERRGVERGMEEGERLLILRLLNRRFGELSESMTTRIEHLSLTQLESLAVELLDFTSLSDLEVWLAEQEQ
jgi:hypothetical protein